MRHSRGQHRPTCSHWHRGFRQCAAPSWDGARSANLHFGLHSFLLIISASCTLLLFRPSLVWEHQYSNSFSYCFDWCIFNLILIQTYNSFPTVRSFDEREREREIEGILRAEDKAMSTVLPPRRLVQNWMRGLEWSDRDDVSCKRVVHWNCWECISAAVRSMSFYARLFSAYCEEPTPR